MSEPRSREAVVGTILRLRQRRLERTATTTVEVEAIAGRILADEITAPRDDPTVDRATMDGYAVAAGDTHPLELARSEVYPEDERPPMGPGEAVPVATGGKIPERADVVLKRETVTIEDGRLRGPTPDPGTNVYPRGSNFAAGETLFERGERLLPKDAVLLDDLSVESVLVRNRWSVGVLATGTEIHEGSRPDRDSHMLVGLARSWGHEAVHEGSVPDDPDRIVDRIGELAREHDIVVTSGGTSVGSRDHVTTALSDLGDVLVSECAISPGSSTTVGVVAGSPIVAVPGRPVAAHAAAILFCRPLLTGRGSYPALRASATVDIELGPDGECLIPVAVDGDGEQVVPTDRGRAGSDGRADRTAGPIDATPADDTYVFRPSVLSSMTRATRADGFVLTDEPIERGETIDVIPYAGIEHP